LCFSSRMAQWLRTELIMPRETPDIMALDLAQRTGFAHTDGAYGVFNFDWRSIPYGLRWRRFEEWLRIMLAEHPSSAIVYEAALHQKGAAARVANAMVTVIEMVGDELALTVKGYHLNTIKKHATGNGRAEKPEMAAAAFARNPQLKLESDDVVDALFLLDLALSDLSEPLPDYLDSEAYHDCDGV
jgi:Holliday junction resolvasome RuvABC endonuclease subunit